MRIILTHEQTDFDGIASLLGAHLLDRTAIPVLPRRMNRNVNAFVTIYGADLPFVDPRDLDDSPIEVIYLVDTQSLTSIKGIHEETKIHVVDHHSKREDLPEDWEVKLIDTGANVTIFVEQIFERDIPLGIAEATLLLLGIYEDTGSLTYSRTTPRDVQAAAVLLEQGANLSIVGDYLNHPLSKLQQKIYDELRASAESHSIHGHNILIAPGDARSMDEELSTIAHKLRDLIDPDAIILIVNIQGGVQLIARSTSDDIDVAKIANHFGGGGHQRAAAALIKVNDWSDVYKELMRILPEFIRPAVTVSEIMSRAPHLLSPQTPVKEIARKMQRYGYEGYPVVENGEILGLVTRRAVDRALNHKLNLTAESLMEAGEVMVLPSASIEDLQTLMVSTGWGQIPVVDPNEKKIIGIVTRTDLLDTLAPPSIQNEKQNLSGTLEKTLPPYRLQLLLDIAQIALEHHVALYIVGGFVRDLLLGFPSLDFDLVVEGDAIQLAEAVKNKFGGRVTTHKQFGTAKWFLDKKDRPVRKKSEAHTTRDELPATLDFITARREFYSEPSALPIVETGSIKLDLHRRDFTINTLALRLDGRHYGKLYDFWGGYSDIRQGLVRVLHSLSFVDDPTRMLRAVRYEQRYGFRIGERTLQLLLEARDLLNRVSGDRIRHEIDNIIEEFRCIEMFNRLDELGLLKSIHPELNWDDWLQEKIRALDLPGSVWNVGYSVKSISVRIILVYTLWFMRQPWSQAEPITKRLRLPKTIKTIVRDACQLWEAQPRLAAGKPSQVTDRLEEVHRLAIYAVYACTDSSLVRETLHTFICKWTKVKPTVTGHDLRDLNLRPGPRFSTILKLLKNAWLDGEISSKEEETELLEKLIKNDNAIEGNENN